MRYGEQKISILQNLYTKFCGQSFVDNSYKNSKLPLGTEMQLF